MSGLNANPSRSAQVRGDSPMRVLIVINRLTESGGAEGSTAQILDGLQSSGLRFAAVTLHGLSLKNRRILEDRGVIFYESGPGFPAQLRTVSRAIREFRPDLVHATLYDSDVVACVAGLLFGVPVMRSIVNTPYDAEASTSAPSKYRLELTRRFDAMLTRFATFRIHAISRTTERSAIKWLGAKPDQIVVVPRGRDIDVLGPKTPDRRRRVREALSLPTDAPVLLNAARQDPQKGQLLLIAAFSEVVERAPEAILLIAGREGSETPALHAAVAERGLGERVRNLGVRDDVPDLLCAADLFVFSSLWEGLGGAVLEAMAMGVPVVAFDAPAVVEALGDTGVVVPRRDTRAMADAIVELLQSSERRALLAVRSRERFDEHFTNAAYLAGMHKMYEQVIRESGAAYRAPLWARAFRSR